MVGIIFDIHCCRCGRIDSKRCTCRGISVAGGIGHIGCNRMASVSQCRDIRTPCTVRCNGCRTDSIAVLIHQCNRTSRLSGSADCRCVVIGIGNRIHCHSGNRIFGNRVCYGRCRIATGILCIKAYCQCTVIETGDIHCGRPGTVRVDRYCRRIDTNGICTVTDRKAGDRSAGLNRSAEFCGGLVIDGTDHIIMVGIIFDIHCCRCGRIKHRTLTRTWRSVARLVCHSCRDSDRRALCRGRECGVHTACCNVCSCQCNGVGIRTVCHTDRISGYRICRQTDTHIDSAAEL